MAQSDTDIRKALEERARKARKRGQVQDERPALKEIHDAIGEGRAHRFEIVDP